MPGLWSLRSFRSAVTVQGSPDQLGELWDTLTLDLPSLLRPSFLSDPTRPAFSQEGSQASPPSPVVLFCSTSPFWVSCSPVPSLCTTLGGGSSDPSLTNTSLGLELYKDSHLTDLPGEASRAPSVSIVSRESPSLCGGEWRNKKGGLAALGQRVLPSVTLLEKACAGLRAQGSLPHPFCQGTHELFRGIPTDPQLFL